MAGLCWMAVTLSVLLYAGSSFGDVDQNKLVGIVNEIVQTYRPTYGVDGKTRKPMFSLAVSIPYDEESKEYDINEVFNTDPADTVKRTILDCEVYTSTRMVAATVLKWPDVLDQCPNEHVQWGDVLREYKAEKHGMTWFALDIRLKMMNSDDEKESLKKLLEGRAHHAEHRTLKAFNPDNFKDVDFTKDLLLFYVLASPCDEKCANEENNWNILESIKKIKVWENYALVFSDVFKPRDGKPIPEDKLRGALESLGKSIGLENIFRCNKQKCTCCSSGGEVTPECFSDDSQPGPSQNFIQGGSEKEGGNGKKRKNSEGTSSQSGKEKMRRVEKPKK